MNKKLHILLLSILCYWASSAQVPVNDLIENAIIVPNENFTDSNVRLDLATNTGVGGSNCGVEAFARVYYKFTAATDNSIDIRVLNSTGQVASSSFAIAYNAPDLNQTDESQLTVLPNNCAFSGMRSINVISGQSYYVQVHRAGAESQESSIQFEIPEDGSQIDRTALIEFYNENGGSSWTNNFNWLSNLPLGSWQGVTVKDGRVTQLNLQSSNVEGNSLSMLLDLDAIESISLQNNMISGLVPDFASLTNLATINLNGNFISFADLEANYSSNTTLDEFVYQNQNSVDMEQNIEGIVGSDYALTMTPIAGTDIKYQWYRANRFSPSVTKNPVDGATSSVLTFSNIQLVDFDSYVCWATSQIITDLIIKRPRVDISAEVSQVEREALMVLYNALDGDNWNDNTNWGTEEPVKEWSHVFTAGNRVIGLDFFGSGGMTGQIPTEIQNLTNLEYLGIGIEPGVSGTLPESIGNLTNLKRLRLQGTSNSGSLPATIGNLVNLEELRLIGNNFSGDLPTTFNNLVSLKNFYVIGSEFVFAGNSNLFTGSLPDFANSPDLNLIQVSGNDFTGELPDYSGLANMNTLVIDNNLYTFDDLAKNQENNLTINNYFFSPQRNNSTEESIVITPGQSVTFDANSNSTEGKTFWEVLATNQYQWFKDETEIEGATSSTYSIADPQTSDSGVYYCEITNTDVLDLIVRRANITLNVDNTASNETVQLSNFRLYPNPATDWINISADNLQNSRSEIYDLSGRLVREFDLLSNTTNLNIEDLNSGIYLLKITTANGKTATKRFIKK
ncbi:Por secretion system C-terminal sorting domain-containing protein [Nonlabens sp. Hel1_33_55]|uniref:T9SS type A sorting domain-containing protein n=1 Tax=Nonlabens sp. Hel1_33_55 TaxID=1336802 RepID=UPI000875D2FD|nr:T9SS type A sorting domain-containing protein [Nonlabens sp. Hel1_33_55]SCY04929.1 Por secretion system C-terminal sorting domain-containing protein [Nonlabens sp. Hel1_33_55]